MKIADVFNVSIDYLFGRTARPEVTLDPKIREFVDKLELSDQEILDRFDLSVDGRKLSPEEAKRFIAFVRAERLMDSPQA